METTMGKRIQEYRCNEEKMDQSDFADKAGITRVDLLELETEASDPSALTLKKLSLNTSINISWVLLGRSVDE